MLLYDAANPAPNPRRVRIFLSEKGLSVPTMPLSIMAGEQKAAEFTSKYPPGQLPVLELDDGKMIGESVAICRFFEALHPEPPLFGASPTEIAEIEMWMRRTELTLMMPVAQVWVNTHPFTARVVKERFADFGEANRPRAFDAMRRFDAALADREFIAGDRFSMADIVLLTTVDFAGFIGLPMPEEATALAAWHTRVSARPSASA